MLTPALKRPALGRSAVLGDLYDARTDRFLSKSIFGAPVLDSTVHKILINTSDTKFSSIDSYKEKFEKLGIGHDLGAYFLAGLLKVDGSARYLTEPKNGHDVVQEVMYHTTITTHEKLNFACGEIRDVLDLTQIESGCATHVVAEITWGATTVVTASHQLIHNEDRRQVAAQSKSAFQRFGNTLLPDYPDLSQFNEKQSITEPFTNVKIFADVLPQHENTPQNLEDAYRLIVNMSHHISNLSSGVGVPLTYTLLPVGFFSIFFDANIKSEVPVQQVNNEQQESFVNLFDDLHTAQSALHKYHKDLLDHQFCIPMDHIDAIATQLRVTKLATPVLKSNYASIVKRIRTGEIEPQQMADLYDKFLESGSAPTKLIALTDKFSEKMKLMDKVVELGGRYVGFNGFSLQTVLLKSPNANAYVFHYSEMARADSTGWNENCTALMELLHPKSDTQRALVVVVDCDASGPKLEKTYISHFENGEIVSKDWVAERKLLANTCLVRYGEHAMDRTIANAPAQRRLVKIPCPASDCDPSVLCDWICYRCHAPIEFGVVDTNLYCDCGRCHFSAYDFKCKSSNHGSAYCRYNKRKLQRLLENLPAPDELNILILGETGVGKSTFVNAFVNYLTFATLDEGLSAAKLNCIIPCSFSTQYVDHSKGGKLVQREVKFGIDEDELDSNKGQSATQKAVVYPLYIGHTLVRLIDTPGIGDVRGTEYDKKNMADVLSVLRNYPKLHGILILLKPNNARLNVMFRFCIKELLTHLAREAAHNMVFGFTNTRGSNYQPGDTFRPLEALLSEYSDVIPGLFKDTVYCFDSESFRYLAARQKGIEMGNIEDYRRSWDQSAIETRRLLNYFRTLRPHDVQSTLSLNETRYLIANLTIPMAEISKSITKSIMMNTEDAKAITENRLTNAQLRTKLNLTKMSLTAYPLARPRTVCSNSACIQMKTDSGKEVIVHKALCHNPCCLTDVPPNSIGTRQLQGCAAFHQGKCTKCSHGWQEHLHVVVEYHEQSILLPDPAIERALAANASQIQLKEAAIAAKTKLIAELKAEHNMIQEAAAQFSVYLSKKSITLYNDATLEYLDHLIREEKSKVGFGADPTRLENLEADRTQYAEFVRTMTLSVDNGSTMVEGTDTRYHILNEEGVYALVSKLYALPHSGSDLRKVTKIVGTAYAATFREKPYRVRGKEHWMSEKNAAKAVRIDRHMNGYGYGSRAITSGPEVENEKSYHGNGIDEKDAGFDGLNEKNETVSGAPPPYESTSTQHSSRARSGENGSSSFFSAFSSRRRDDDSGATRSSSSGFSWSNFKGRFKKTESRSKVTDPEKGNTY